MAKISFDVILFPMFPLQATPAVSEAEWLAGLQEALQAAVTAPAATGLVVPSLGISPGGHTTTTRALTT